MTYDELKKVDILVASPAESITSQDSEDQGRPPLPKERKHIYICMVCIKCSVLGTLYTECR